MLQDNPSGNQKLDQQQVLVLGRALAGCDKALTAKGGRWQCGF